MDYTFYQPEYYLKFRCTGEKCLYSCCDNWNVDWFEKDYDRLINNSSMSAGLRETIENRTEMLGKVHVVKRDDDGRCPFHNRENGLCNIQCELGEEYLPYICREYPRKFMIMDGRFILRQCTTTCPAVLHVLMHDKKAFKFEEVPVRSFATDRVKIESPEKLARVPYLRFRKPIIEFFSWLLTSGRNIEISLLMGVLAARKISDSVESGAAVSIPGALAYLKNEWKSGDPDINIENIRVDYKSKYSFVDFLITKLDGIPFDMTALYDGEIIDGAKYAEGRSRFYSAVVNPDIALGNIAMNVFLNLFTVLKLIDRSFFDFYIYYTLCMSAILYLGYTAAYIGKDTENDFIQAVAVLCRRLIHNEDGAEIIFENTAQIHSPEQLAMIIK